MWAQMKMHHTKKKMFEVVLIFPNKTRKHSFITRESVGRIENGKRTVGKKLA